MSSGIEERESSLNYRRDIDGLRAVAVLAVLFFHAEIPGFNGGFVGVDIFFVISGFLIARLIFDQIRRGKFSLVVFWERRVRRIFPALFVVSVLSFVIAWRVLLPVDFVQFGHSLMAQTCFSQNVLFWSETGYFQAPASSKPMLHTWTLAVEEQFYLFFPLAMFLLARFAKRALVWAVLVPLAASFALSVWTVQNHPSLAFYWLPMRAWELLLGVALNFTPRLSGKLTSLTLGHKGRVAFNEAAALVGVSLVIYSVAMYDRNTPFPGVAAAAPCVGAALLIWSGSAGGSLVSRSISVSPIVGLGLISYSLYLWHMPILVFWRALVVRRLTLPETVVAMGLAGGLAWFSYRYVETPVRRGIFPKTRRQLFANAAAGICLVAILGAAAHFSRGFPGRFGLEDRYLAETYAPEFTDSACPPGHPERSFATKTCVVGHASASASRAVDRAFVLWGDSHADALLPAFDDLADRRHITGYYSWASGCPPIAGVYPRNAPGDRCQKNADQTIAAIAASGVKAVVLVGRWSAYVEGRDPMGVERDEPDLFLSDEESTSTSSAATEAKAVFAKHLTMTVDALVRLGVRVWLVKDVPDCSFFVPKKLISVAHRGGEVSRVGITLSQHLHRQAYVSSVIDQLVGPEVRVIDPTQLLCQPQNFCRAERDGWSMYKDDDHLSPHGARRIQPAFEDMFAEFARAQKEN